MRLRLVLLAVPLLGIAAAHATTMAPMERTCPIGGAKYASFEIMSTSSFGIQLDLRRIGPQAHLPYIECPNGFIVFKDEADFTADEIARLTPVVASAAYQDLRNTDVPAMRLVPLDRALGAGQADIAYRYLSAAFEAEDRGDQALRQTHLAEAAQAYAALLAGLTPKDADWWPAQIRAADIARQRGRFPEAMTMAAALQQAVAPDPKLAWLKELSLQIVMAAAAEDTDPKPYRAPK